MLLMLVLVGILDGAVAKSTAYIVGLGAGYLVKPLVEDLMLILASSGGRSSCSRCCHGDRDEPAVPDHAGRRHCGSGSKEVLKARAPHRST